MSGTASARRAYLYLVPPLFLLAAFLLLFFDDMPGSDPVLKGNYPTQIVYVRSQDEILDAGAIFNAPKDKQKPVALIWIHGWGANFYQPEYVMIGRALADRGYTTIIGNTRMHDLANVEGFRADKRLRGGGYWGIASDQTKDIAAWVEFAASLGFKRVVLVGHSAGWAAVRNYDYLTRDPRVIGLVAASGQVQPDDPLDPQMLADASRLVAADQGDQLIQLPQGQRPYPSYISAATYLDMSKVPPELADFYGIRNTSSPGVAAIRCPLLVMFGTDDDVGTANDLDVIKSAIRRQSSGPPRVDTVMIGHGDHMYQGQETQVAEVLSKWMSNLSTN